jgi:hypothetical protein
MANTSIILTQPRTDTNTFWLQTSPTDQSSFTADEYNNTILPYWQWVETLDGFISVVMTYPDELTKKTIYTFDTPENANSAWNQMHGGAGNGNVNQNILSKNRNQLTHSKMDSSRANTFATVSFVTE